MPYIPECMALSSFQAPPFPTCFQDKVNQPLYPSRTNLIRLSLNTVQPNKNLEDWTLKWNTRREK